MDQSSVASIVEMSFVFLVFMGFCVWQLVSVRREIARDKLAAAKTVNPDVVATR